MFRNIEMGAPCRSPRREQPEPSLLAARQSVCYIIFCKQEVCTLVYRIDVHARLLILRKKSTLYGLILDCTFIDFEEKFPPARLFHPARLLILVIY